MPELPEVETLRQELSKEIVGRKVKSATVSNGKVVGRNRSAKEFRTLLEGHTLKSASRLGDYIVFGLENGTSLVMRPGPTGSLKRAKSAKEAKEKFTHIVIVFTQGGELRFVDPKSMGEMFISTPLPEGESPEFSPASQVAMGGEGVEVRTKVPELAPLGFDPIEDIMSWERFAVVMHANPMDIKSFITNQALVAGIGDIYADEILFAAGLRYDRQTDSLSTIEVRRLWRSLVEIVAEAIKHGGTTIDAVPFTDVFGKPGNFQQFLEVYEREGEPCRRCRRPILKEKNGNTVTFFCEHCQI